jgi:hypothetical protein
VTCEEIFGGAEGTRTPDPHTASVVRYQLRHGPQRPARLGTRAIVHTRDRAGITEGAPQFSVGSAGKSATAAVMPPWRRSTIGHRSSGRVMNASPGRASKTNQEPESSSSSS